MGTRRRRVSVIYFISKLVKWDDLHMEIISNPKQVEIKKAAQALKDGHLVAFPTETVYGLGADATNKTAVSRIYSVKGRPLLHPLIVHISSISQVGQWAIEIPEYALKLADKFWPGPMTLIFKRSSLANDFITGGQKTVGIRVPADSIALELLNIFEESGGKGVAAPSANRFGAVSPTCAEAVIDEIGDYLLDQDLVLDGGRSQVGIESSIVDCTDSYPKILRPGVITQEKIIETTGLKTIIQGSSSDVRVSGSLKRHYSPRAQLIIGSEAARGDGFLALNSESTPEGAIRLASPSTASEFAQQLYHAIRKGDNLGLKRIVVSPPPEQGIALAIWDRLTKASSAKN
jgi:L-threonylcarbamoyladenylate synthase